MMNEDKNSDIIFKELVILANNGKQRLDTLNRLKSACDALVSHGKEFTGRDIQVFCKRTFDMGPTAQSIYNDKSLQKYVEARKAEVTLRKRKKSTLSLEQQIELIEDPELKAGLRILYSNYVTCSKKIEMIESALMNLTPPLELGCLLSGKSPREISAAANPILYNETHKIALSSILRRFLDKSTVVRFGLHVDNGDIVSRGMRETFISKTEIVLLSELYNFIGGTDVFGYEDEL